MPCCSIVHLGPWGGEDGAHWSYTAKGSISGISVTCDTDAIRSISFTSGDGHSYLDKSPVFGTPTGPPKEISIDPRVEKLVLMEGIVGIYNSMEVVTQLSFTTSKNGVTTKHGPYGSEGKGTEFSCPLNEDPFAGFHGHCGETLNSIGVMVRNGELVQSWGGEGGAPWSYTTQGTISHISISYGDVIRAIRFTSKDANGHLEHSETFGDSDPKHEYHEIEIDTTTEKLNGITGTCGTYANMILITSLAFTTTNFRTLGSFGTRRGTPFQCKVDNDEVMYGFHGRAGCLIDAIGVYKRPSKASENGIVVGPFGGNYGKKWTYQPNGLISRISLTYIDSWVTSISFESKDEQGNIDRSRVYGKTYDEKDNKYEININDKVGKLIGISGKIGVTSGNRLVVASLSFTTNKKITYGPFGPSEAGTHFSITAKDGFFTGFHGSDLENNFALFAFGVYVAPII